MAFPLCEFARGYPGLISVPVSWDSTYTDTSVHLCVSECAKPLGLFWQRPLGSIGTGMAFPQCESFHGGPVWV